MNFHIRADRPVDFIFRFFHTSIQDAVLKFIFHTAINDLRVVPIFISKSIMWWSTVCIEKGVKTCHVLVRCSVCLQLTSQGRKTGIASLWYGVEQSQDICTVVQLKEAQN